MIGGRCELVRWPILLICGCVCCGHPMGTPWAPHGHPQNPSNSNVSRLFAYFQWQINSFIMVHHEVIAGGVVVLVRQLVKAAPSEALHFWGSRMRSPIFHIFDAVLRCHSAILPCRAEAKHNHSYLCCRTFARPVAFFPSEFAHITRICREIVSPQFFQTNLSVHQLASNSSTWG